MKKKKKNHSSALINFPPSLHVNDGAEAKSLFSRDSERLQVERLSLKNPHAVLCKKWTVTVRLFFFF